MSASYRYTVSPNYKNEHIFSRHYKEPYTIRFFNGYTAILLSTRGLDMF